MAKRSGLGRGLDSIIPATSISSMDKKSNAEKADNKVLKSTNSSEKITVGKNLEAKANAAKITDAKSTGAKAADTKATGAKAADAKATGAKTADAKGASTAKSAAKSVNLKNDDKSNKVVNPSVDEPVKTEIMMKLTKIEPNRNQPRKEFDEDALQELAESIKNHGIIQPLIVRKVDNQYEIVAGERRWRAARLAGLKEVPVVIKEYTDSEMAEIALVENLQREDLNPIEEAMAYQRLLDEFALKQEEVAFRVSKSRSVITNSLRLLKLHPQVQEMLAEGKISTGHGKVILGLDTPEEQLMVANMIVEETLSVRQTEERIRLIQNPKVPAPKKELANQLVYQNLEDKIRQYVNTKVVIHRSNEKKGKIEISYDSLEELERIVDVIGVKL